MKGLVFPSAIDGQIIVKRRIIFPSSSQVEPNWEVRVEDLVPHSRLDRVKPMYGDS